MDVMETDSVTKSAKKKKINEEQAVKNSRKISDFFKTPDKNTEKQRQKSLLQFFSKSTEEQVNPDEELVVISEETVKLDSEIVTTPTGSDKENSEILDENLGVKPENRGSNAVEKIIDKAEVKDNKGKGKKENKALRKHKKHKQKKHSLDRDDESSNTSHVSLSDASLSNQSSNEGSRQATNSMEHKNEMKLNKDQDLKEDQERQKPTDCVKTKQSGKVSLEVLVVGAVNDNSNKKTEVANKLTDNNLKHEKHKKKRNKSKDDNEISEENSTCLLNEPPKDKTKGNEDVLNEKHDKAEICSAEIVENEKGIQKKNTLKGKDMLDILKQIQSEDAENKRKKKHKKKHKNKQKEKDAKQVHELANSEGNSDEKEEVQDTRTSESKNNKFNEQKDCKLDEKIKDESKISICNEIAVKEKSIKCNGNLDNLRNVDADVQKHDKQKQVDKFKANKQKKKSDGKEKQIKVKETRKQNVISYEKFSKSLDNKKAGKDDDINGEINETKLHITKEMSYSDYLKIMEKETDNDEVQDTETNESIVEVDITESEGQSEMEIDVLEKNVESTLCATDDTFTNEVMKQSSKKEITKFFKCMTSTPDKETIAVVKENKKEVKMKSKEKKHKNFSKKNTDAQLKSTESKSDVEVIEVDSISIPEKDSNVNCGQKKIQEVKTDSVKSDVAAKSLFSGKKTQATLSFGKTGLTVAKPVVQTYVTKQYTVVSGPLKIENNSEVCMNDKPEGNCSEKRRVGRPKLNNKTNKPTNKKLEEDNVVEKGLETKDKGRTSRKDQFNLNSTDSSVFMTPESKERKRPVKRKMDASFDGDSESADSGERRKSLRKRYKVEAFQMDADKKTPIKIKLKRCPKSSSSADDGDQTTVLVKKKKTTAQALLEKAKKSKLKKNKQQQDNDKPEFSEPKEVKKKHKKSKTRNESNSSEDSVTRRSSRLEGRAMPSMEEVSLENIVISSSDDEGSEVKKKKTKKPKKLKELKSSEKGELKEGGKKGLVKTTVEGHGTPKKESVKKIGSPAKTRTPVKKSGTKLAPMFLMGKNKPAEPSPKKPPLDPEQAKQRQQFLMSGVPDELRKQTAIRIAAQADADYPPIPKINHVQQVPADVSVTSGLLNVWDLKRKMLNERRFIIPCTVYPSARFTGDLMSTYQTKLVNSERIKDFHQHDPFQEEEVDLCLQEISGFNPSCPVMSMYKALKHMKSETEKPPAKSESMLKTDMKGILDGCTDMVVIDDDDNKDKKKTKKSLKIQKKEQVDKKEVTKPEEKPDVPACSLLWTEKYCPATTSDVLGNSSILKKLKTWLTEWKHVLDREARKARKLLMKKNKGKQLPSKKGADDAWDDDSDFDMDSDDSEEDESICNTMLISGPHGSGKTSSVYALALELGFKVHEVNASSCRSGKQILSQLQEATQSHQVSTQGNHTPRKNTGLGDKPKPENKLPSAFTNLFKKAEAKPAENPEEKQAGKKRKRHKSDKEKEVKHKTLQLILEDSCSQNASRSLNLSSTTLILFDEVDVVFEEDKGFLSAIQNFMSNTKIPIILTTSDPGFSHTFDGRYEQLNFKRPSVASIVSHLQTVSLVENVRTDPVLLGEIAQFYNCDVRRCLTLLQYLLKTGGGHSIVNKTVLASKDLKKNVKSLGFETENSQCSSQSDSRVLFKSIRGTNQEDQISESSRNVDNSDDDFVTIKPLKKRRRVLDDDNSNSTEACSEVTQIKVVNLVDTEDSQEAHKCLPVHSIGMETLFRNGDLSIAETLSQGVKTQTTLSLRDMIGTGCLIKQSTNTDLFYNNLHLLLPFKTQVMDTVLKPAQVSNHQTINRKRIRVQSDLYASEASNDVSQVENTVENDTITENMAETKMDTENVPKGNKSENLCLAKTLSSFSKFYDIFSSVDIFESKEKLKITDRMQSVTGSSLKGTLQAGVENDLADYITSCETDLEMCRSYISEIEARSLCKMYCECENIKTEVDRISEENGEFAENFVLPVNRQSEQFTLVDNNIIRTPSDYSRALDNTVDNLPHTVHKQSRTVHLDYLPTLREICRTEQCRQVTNTKRRFHHYLDSITLPLKDKTLATLATTFT